MEKFVIIKKSDKSKEGLPIKSLNKEIKQLKKEGYKIYNRLITIEEFDD